MKRHLFCWLLVSLLIPAQSAAAQQVKLKANLQFPITNPLFGGSMKRFKEEVERQTENGVVVEIFDKAQLFTDYQVVDAVASGAVDIAMTAAQQFAYKAPLVGILEQPFLFNFEALLGAAAKPGSEVRTQVDEVILSQIGVRVLWWQALGNTVFLSNGQDVADPLRLKGQRVAAPGKLPAEVVEWCGGKPVVLTIEKFHAAFGEGAVDMAVGGFGALPALGLRKFADTVTFTWHTPLTMFLVINEKTWQSLSLAHRTQMAQAAAKVEVEIGALTAESEARARAFSEKTNVKLQGLTPDQVADWRACSAGMLADYMERNGEGARRLMDAYGRLRMDPCCSTVPGDFTRR
jgi:TRAP-type C4-dicarboxylate transport system substrate-binding protein